MKVNKLPFFPSQCTECHLLQIYSKETEKINKSSIFEFNYKKPSKMIGNENFAFEKVLEKSINCKIRYNLV